MYQKYKLFVSLLIIFTISCNNQGKSITESDAERIALDYLRSLPKRIFVDPVVDIELLPAPLIRIQDDGYFLVIFSDSIQNTILSVFVSPSGAPEFGGGGWRDKPPSDTMTIIRP